MSRGLGDVYKRQVQLLGRGNLSLTAYVDNILRHHLEFYREEINRLHKQRNSQNIL